jgi:uncharacterized protein (DUF433 family)
MQDKRYFSSSLAETIGNISRRQAIDWARDGMLVPSKLYAHDERPYVFFYSFHDLVALRLIWMLRHRFGLSLRSALTAADYVRANSESPWSDLQFWVFDKRVWLSKPESDSAVLVEVAPVAEQVKAEADKLWYRGSDDYGKIEFRRDVLGGTLVVKGTRISVATVANLLGAGWDIDQIRRGYPTLQPEDILGVMRYVEEQRKVA